MGRQALSKGSITLPLTNKFVFYPFHVLFNELSEVTTMLPFCSDDLVEDLDR